MNPQAENVVDAVHSTALFRGQYCFRTLNGTLASVVPLLFSVSFAVISSRVFAKADDLLQRQVGYGFGVGSLVVGSVGLYALLGVITNRRIEVEINEDGIINGSRLRPWNEVNSITGKKYFNGVCIEFSAGWRTMSAPTTPLLTEQRYIEIVQELHRRIAVRFPNVKIAMLPVDVSDTS